MRQLLRHALRSLVAGLVVATALPALAQRFPDKPIRWIVPYPPGGGSDVIARTLAEAMYEDLHQTVVVENRPGGASTIAVSALLQSPPDGYTVMHGENASLMWNEHFFRKLNYDPVNDFTYIGAMGRFPVALVVHPSFPAKTVSELIDYAKKNPGTLSYGSPGNGTPHHLAMELFKQKTRLDIVHVPYKGSAPAMQEVMANQIPMMILDLASGLPSIRSGKVRAIAVFMPERAKALPDVPTFKESGLDGIDAFAFHGLIGPAKMPADVVARLNAALNKALSHPRTVKLFTDTGAEAAPGTPQQFRDAARAESKRWGPVIKAADIRMD